MRTNVALRAVPWLLCCALCWSACRNEGAPAASPPIRELSGEGQPDAYPPQPAIGSGSRVVLSPPGRAPVTVQVEVADSEPERRQGLMFRKALEPYAGMLFLFAEPEHLTFWMHNTLIPLDMIFIEQSLKVLGVVENAEPETDTTREVPGLSQYVLEVRGGFARAHGIAAGTRVQFEEIPMSATGR